MRKMRLELDAVDVESFAMALPRVSTGTVRAHGRGVGEDGARAGIAEPCHTGPAGTAFRADATRAARAGTREWSCTRLDR